MKYSIKKSCELSWSLPTVVLAIVILQKTAWFSGGCRCPATVFRREATSHGVRYNRNPMQAPGAARGVG